ncbi:MAG: YfhO family protein [Chloroherpetonaceae bacterium]|nr:YfhO family protein [Chloroherpetonaceae bacterium]
MTNSSTNTLQLLPLRIDFLGKSRNIEIPLAALILLFILLAFFYQIVFQGKILLPLDIMNTMYLPYAEGKTADVHNHFINDALTHYYPVAQLTREAWLSGDLSLWNPYIFGGFPQFANSCFVQFTPLNIILTLGDMPGAYHRLLLTELWIAGFGMFLLLRRFGIAYWIALLFAAVYMLNGKFMTNLHFRYMVSAFCWVPFMIATLDWAIEERKIWHYGLVCLFTALAFLGSSLQTAVFVVVIFTVFYYFRSLESRVPSISSLLLIPLAIGIISLILSLAAWVPYLEFFLLDESNRVATNSKHYTLLQRLLSLPFLITIPFPDLLGSPRALDASKLLGTTLDEFSAYIGFLPFYFSLVAAFTLWKMAKARPFILLMILGLGLPILTPLYKLLYHRFWMVFVFGALIASAIYMTKTLEGFWDKKQLQNHIKIGLWGIIVVFFLQIIAGLAIVIKRDEVKAKVEGLLNAAMKSNIAAQGNESWFLARSEKVLQHFSLTSFDLWFPLILAAFTLTIWALWLKRKVNPIISYLAISLAVILSLWKYDFNWLPVSDPMKTPLYPETVETRFLKSDSTDFRVMTLHTQGERWIFYPNYLAAYGISTIDGNSNMGPRNVGWLAEKKIEAERLSLLNVKYLLVHKKREIRDTNFVKCFEGAISIYRNKLWAGGAYFSGVAAVQKPNERNFSRDTVYFESHPNFVETLESKVSKNPLHDSFEISIIKSFEIIKFERGKNQLTVQFQTNSSGWVVIPNTDYNGWRAYINNYEVALHRVNYAMQAVFVKKGESVLQLIYQPRWHRMSLWVSMISWVITFFAITTSFLIERRKQ